MARPPRGPPRLGPEGGPGEVERLDLALLRLEPAKLHRPTIDSRRGPRLEARRLEPELGELFRERLGRSLTRPPPTHAQRGPHMDAAAEEGPGGDHHRAGAEAPPLGGDDPSDLAVGAQLEAGGGALQGDEVRLRLDEAPHRPLVEPAVGLCTRRPHSGALPTVQHPKLDRRQIGRAPHHPAQRIDLPDHRPLGDPTHRGIAGELADRLERGGEQRDARPPPSRRSGGLGPGVPAADHDHVERGHP